MIKESIRSNAPVFSARRMAEDYATPMYLPAYQTSDITNTDTDKNANLSREATER